MTPQQIALLQSYRDKAYVSNILCEDCSTFYSNLKSLVNIPLILSSSVMAILNSSSFEAETMKIPNVVINSVNALLLSLISNFKLVEKSSNFKSIGNKFNKLCHAIEDKLTNDQDNITTEHIRMFITEYDNLNESLEYSYLEFIKNKIQKKYKDTKCLPNALNCTTTFQVDQSAV